MRNKQMLLLIQLIAKQHEPAHKLAFHTRSGYLVARTFADNFPLKLGKRQQDIQRQL